VCVGGWWFEHAPGHVGWVVRLVVGYGELSGGYGVFGRRCVSNYMLCGRDSGRSAVIIVSGLCWWVVKQGVGDEGRGGVWRVASGGGE
jgi:hypothetical protein